MSNDRMQQIVTALYAHRKLALRGVSEHRADSLALFVERMNKHVDYYCGNPQVSTGFEFLAKVINAWFPRLLINGEFVAVRDYRLSYQSQTMKTRSLLVKAKVL